VVGRLGFGGELGQGLLDGGPAPLAEAPADRALGRFPEGQRRAQGGALYSLNVPIAGAAAVSSGHPPNGRSQNDEKSDSIRK
jgi:hypothetical protein